MNFEETQAYLFSLGNEVEAMKLGLGNIGTLLNALDNPQDKYLKVQVAGTNGKGSVCAFLDSICCQGGIRTGLYTSPHLVSITERIKINGKEITEEKFASAATLVRETCEELLSTGDLKYRPTFFEQMTAIALRCFADAGIDLAILETGMGGRLDATTASNAEVAGITRIDFDHREYLGDTLEKIAAEKAAIIRSDSRVIIGEQAADSHRIILQKCADLGVSPRSADEVSAKILPLDPSGAEHGSFRADFTTSEARYQNVSLGIAGRHQIENAKTAILIAEELRAYFKIADEDIIAGLGAARHPGRLEFDGQFLFDGAHNKGGAQVLREYVEEIITKPITLIFGVMKGKDAAEMAGEIFPKAEKIILTRPANSRAMSLPELRQISAESLSGKTIFETESAEQAVKLAISVTDPNDIILVTGSLYLVGEVKSIANRLQSSV